VEIKEPRGLGYGQPLKLLLNKISKANLRFLWMNNIQRGGIDLLIRAVKKLPDAHLVLIGEGSQRGAMMSFTKRLNASDRVTFTGHISRREMWVHLMKASLFAMPTRASFHEGSNRAVLEAMLCGLPVVVTRTGGLPELIVDGGNGFVVEPGDVEGLVRAITTLLHDPKLRESMGRANKLKAKKYSIDVLTSKRYEYLAMLSRGA